MKVAVVFRQISLLLLILVSASACMNQVGGVAVFESGDGQNPEANFPPGALQTEFLPSGIVRLSAEQYSNTLLFALEKAASLVVLHTRTDILDFLNLPIGDQKEAFSVLFDLSVDADVADVLIGLSESEASFYSDIAVGLRFAPSGRVDARDSAEFRAQEEVLYEAGKIYRIQIDVDVPAQAFSVWMKAEGDQAFRQIADSYRWREGLESVTALQHLVLSSAAGSRGVLENLEIRPWNPSRSVYRSFAQELQHPFQEERRVDRFLTSRTFLRITDEEAERALIFAEQISGKLVEILSASHEFCFFNEANPGLSCRETVVRSLGTSLFRRPLSSEELVLYREFLDVEFAESDAQSAIRVLFQALALSPYSMHRSEIGSRPGSSGFLSQLSSHELADLVSYTLLGRPDRELLALADTEELLNPIVLSDKIEKRTQDLVELPSLKDFLKSYVRYHETREEDKEIFGAAVRDTDLLIKELIRREAHSDFFRKLLTTDLVYIHPETAELYGRNPQTISPDGEFSRDFLRKGVFTQPSWLMARASSRYANPMTRGRHIYEDLMCGSMPNFDVADVPDLSDDPNLTMRQKLEMHAQGTCQGCHQVMDPHGFPFDRFGHLGQFRTEELPGVPVNEAGFITGLSPMDDGPVSNLNEYMNRLANSSAALDCFLAHLYKYYTGDSRPPLPRSKNVQDLRLAYDRSGGDLSQVLRAMMVSPSMIYRRLNP